MKIGITSDHRGFETKEKLKEFFKDKIELIDYGTNSKERVDYPKYGILLGEKVRDKEVEYGIAICGSAIGISIACNNVLNYNLTLDEFRMKLIEELNPKSEVFFEAEEKESDENND